MTKNLRSHESTNTPQNEQMVPNCLGVELKKKLDVEVKEPFCLHECQCRDAKDARDGIDWLIFAATMLQGSYVAALLIRWLFSFF